MRLKAWHSRSKVRRKVIWHFIPECTARLKLDNPIETEMDSAEIPRLLKTEVCHECRKLSRRLVPGYVIL